MENVDSQIELDKLQKNIFIYTYIYIEREREKSKEGKGDRSAESCWFGGIGEELFWRSTEKKEKKKTFPRPPIPMIFWGSSPSLPCPVWIST